MRDSDRSQPPSAASSSSFDLLKPDKEATNKRRLAFAKRHANETWQADTLFGPRVGGGGPPCQAVPASPRANSSPSSKMPSRLMLPRPVLRRRKSPPPPSKAPSSKPPSTNAALPQNALRRQRLHLLLRRTLRHPAPALGVPASATPPVRDGGGGGGGAAKGKVERFFRTVRDPVFSSASSISPPSERLNEQFIAWARRRIQPPPPRHPPRHEARRNAIAPSTASASNTSRPANTPRNSS